MCNTLRLLTVKGWLQECPICFEALLVAGGATGGRAEELVFCGGQCGKYLHARCMQLQLMHRRREGLPEQCPMCRAPWKGAAAR